MQQRQTDFWRHHRRRFGRALLVTLGIVLGQCVLYGPALLGWKILLPLDILTRRGVYLPQTSEVKWTVIHDLVPIDIITFYEPARRSAVADLAAGNLPLWSPYRFAGAPSYRWCLSPPFLPGYLIASPVVLAWVQLLIALVAGGGAYVFFRCVLDVGFWPAALTAWCYPLSGAFVVWQGFWLPPVMCWLPWMLLAVDQTVRRPAGWGGPLLALVTGFVLVGGALDIAGQVLLAAGIYAVWRVVAQYGNRALVCRAGAAVAGVSLAWLLGILAVAWMLLPLFEYAHEGARTAQRIEGVKERPPVGLAALPQVVLPGMYGSTSSDSLRIMPDNLPESSAAAYAGLLATLFVAPLAACSRRHRSMNALWVLLTAVSLSWALNLPGLVQLAKLPGLNLMSHNRFVFVAGFAILALAATGLEVLSQPTMTRRWWFLLPAAILSGLCLWCCYRTVFLPEPIGAQLGAAVQQGTPVAQLRDLASVSRIQQNYMGYYAMAATLCCVAATGWGLVWAQVRQRAWFMPTVGALMLAELLGFADGRSTQCDPALDYPRLPILERLAQAPPGRMLGCDCLPANLPRLYGLRDIRGYDGIDPGNLLDLMRLSADPRMPAVPYAMTQWFVPRAIISPTGDIHLSPLLDMLNVRYVVFRGSPQPGWKPVLQDIDYWVLENKRALPRAYVPERVELVADETRRLERLAAPDFDARRVAYVETPVQLPANCRGTAEIVAELSQRVVLQANMQTVGLVVLADRWDPGWNVSVNGRPAPLLTVNHALRGVVVPAGRSQLEFRYEPASLGWGLRLGLVAALVWMVWAGYATWRWRRPIPAGYSAVEPAEQLVGKTVEVPAGVAAARARRLQPAPAPAGCRTKRNHPLRISLNLLLLVILTEHRDGLIARLDAAQIGYGIHYCTPIHRMPAYRFLGYPEGSLPVTEAAACRVLSLPCYPGLPLDVVQQVCTALTGVRT